MKKGTTPGPSFQQGGEPYLAALLIIAGDVHFF